jgi:predicted nucleic acid-binding protein
VPSPQRGPAGSANILLYAISRDPAEQDKAKRANDILTGRDLALSVQVLQEFYVQGTRAGRRDPITHQQAVRLIESFRRFPVQDVTSAILMAALDTRQRWRPKSGVKVTGAVPIPGDVRRWR